MKMKESGLMIPPELNILSLIGKLDNRMVGAKKTAGTLFHQVRILSKISGSKIYIVGGWTDHPCNAGKCCICENEEAPVLTLRGLCEDTVLDTFYVPHNPDNSGTMVFTGLMGTMIQFNDDQLR